MLAARESSLPLAAAGVGREGLAPPQQIRRRHCHWGGAGCRSRSGSSWTRTSATGAARTRMHARSAPGAPLSKVRRGLLAVGGRTNVLVESGRGTHHGAVADMSGRVKARAGRLAADLLGSATHAVTPDDPEGGLALGQETLLKDKVKAITAATAHIQAVRRGKSMPADEAEALRVAALAATTELLGAIDRDRRAVEGPARDLGKALTALAAPGAVRCGPCAGQCNGACAHGPARIATRANAVAAAEAATLRQQQAKVAAAQSSGLDQTSATQSLESFSK